ncbi:precorrin-6y C5,15-methyltransferase (decarboxylating) subunit CbiE [Dactylosporangium sp. NPDC048998]|uniref:precorrin-6y C5,15-methyltransferase (decarboxylating) subunit CbiE n=1 Tax=Dactylosporangium sp. NPDC048998 TaxID=3363976 RepID=UPI00371D9A0B
MGIGADAYAGLTEAGRNAIETADVVFGGARQLALLPPHRERPDRGALSNSGALSDRVALSSRGALSDGGALSDSVVLLGDDVLPVHGVQPSDGALSDGGVLSDRGPLSDGGVSPGRGVDSQQVCGVDWQERIAWPSPLVPALPRLLAEQYGRRVCVLASGDPMHYGIGTTIVRILGAAHVHVVPHPSSVSLACARLGWAVEDVDVVSAVGRSVDVLRRYLHDRRRVLVLGVDGGTPREVWRILEETGFEGSDVTILESLGAGDERIHRDPDAARALHIVAVECRGAGGAPVVPGLADARYDSDGQLTKREIRAVTLAALGPRPGELLWDVGAGSGSIAIEWLRAHRACRAVAVERDEVRAGRVAGNARRLGVPGLSLVVGAAPEALDGLEAPDAVFIGGGFTVPGVFERCWGALRPGGRLVVNAVTVESERLVAELHAAHGGELTRIAVNRAAPVGGFLGWRPMMPVTQWVVEK